MKAKTTINGKKVWVEVEELRIDDATERDADIIGNIEVLNDTNVAQKDRTKFIPLKWLIELHATCAREKNVLVAFNGEKKSHSIPLPDDVRDKFFEWLCVEHDGELLDIPASKWMDTESLDYLKAWIFYRATVVRGNHKNAKGALGQALSELRKVAPNRMKEIDGLWSVNYLRTHMPPAMARKKMRIEHEKKARRKQEEYAEENANRAKQKANGEKISHVYGNF